MQYRQVYVEGGCYFFTLALTDRKSDLLVRKIDCLLATFKAAIQNHPFDINAMVVMLPDRKNSLWKLKKKYRT